MSLVVEWSRVSSFTTVKWKSYFYHVNFQLCAIFIFNSCLLLLGSKAQGRMIMKCKNTLRAIKCPILFASQFALFLATVLFIAWCTVYSAVILSVCPSVCHSHGLSWSGCLSCYVVTFRVSWRPREMYCGHARLCVCLSVCPRLHAYSIARTRM